MNTLLRIFLLISCFMFFVPNLQAQKKGKKKETTEQVVKNVTWNILEHDFGKIKNNEPVTILFKFTNITDKPIFIDNVRTLCGCTAPDWSYDPTLPNMIGEVKVDYDAKKEGPFEKSIKVFFHDQKKPDILWIKGEVLENEANN